MHKIFYLASILCISLWICGYTAEKTELKMGKSPADLRAGLQKTRPWITDSEKDFYYIDPYNVPYHFYNSLNPDRSLPLVLSIFPLNILFVEDQKGGCPTWKECPIFKVETDYYYEFLNDYEKRELPIIRNCICKKIKTNELTVEEAAYILRIMIHHAGCCEGEYMNPDYREHLKENKIGQEVINVYEKYCSDSYDPKGTLGIKTKDKKQYDRFEWWKNEFFCQVMRQMAYPEIAVDVIKEGDLPSLDHLQKQAISICEKLRNKEITFDEARYRWNQEYSWFKKQIGPESWGFIIKKIPGSIEFMHKLFK